MVNPLRAFFYYTFKILYYQLLFLLAVVYDSQGMQIVCAIVSILSYVLRETPEYAETVETVIFHENVNLMSLFQNGNDPLKYVRFNFL